MTYYSTLTNPASMVVLWDTSEINHDNDGVSNTGRSSENVHGCTCWLGSLIPPRNKILKKVMTKMAAVNPSHTADPRMPALAMSISKESRIAGWAVPKIVWKKQNGNVFSEE